MTDNSQQLIVLARRCYLRGPRWRSTQALHIDRGRIRATGSRQVILRRRARGVRVIDLADAVVTPGLWDCHTHFFYWALGRTLEIDVSACTTLDAVIRTIRSQGTRRRIGDWVVARGLDHNRWGSEFPTARDLDHAVTDVPTMVHSRDGHSVLLNSTALRRLKITSRTPDPPGGAFDRDQRGRPTGVVRETAIEQLPNPVREIARHPTASAYRTIDRALRAGENAAHELGIVGIHSMDDACSLTHLQRRRADNTLGLRFVHAIPLANLEHAGAIGLRSGLGDEWLRVGGLKIFSDGALGSQTAHMFDNYPGKKGFFGVPTFTEDELHSDIRSATERGFAVWVHAIGDRAVHIVLNAISAAKPPTPLPLPHRIEHAQCVRTRDARRMARLGVVASVQPCHIIGDIVTAQRHWPRAQRDAYPFRQLLDAGVTLACGSDIPIESIDPRRSFFGATLRTDEDFAPTGGWYPQQRMTADEVLYAFTRGAALAAGQPLPAGTLQPGALADLTVWDDDPLKIAPERFLSAGIRGCVVGGRVHVAGCD